MQGAELYTGRNNQYQTTLSEDVAYLKAFLDGGNSKASGYSSLHYSFPINQSKGATFYESAFAKFKDMLTGKAALNLKRAVFLCENAYYQNTMPYQDFDHAIRNTAALISLKMKQEGIPVSDLSKNVSIYRFMADTFKVRLPGKEGKTFIHYPFTYDFEDYNGQGDYKKMFVSKLLMSHSGQCHSLPLLYLLLADELGAKAWLSYSPNHSFIKFMVNGQLQNYETTNGYFTTDAFVLQSGFVKAEALARRTYLDTLNKKQLISHCLMDLALGYSHKYGNGEFTLKCAELALTHHPQNIVALMTKANYYAALFGYLGQQAREQRLPNVSFAEAPRLQEVYFQMLAAQKKLDDAGFAEQ